MHTPALLLALLFAQAPGNGVRFDASFAQQAVEYQRTRDTAILKQLAASPAAAHLLAHARNFDYDLPRGSAEALVSKLLASDRAEACEQSIRYFDRMAQNPEWIADVLRYLPDGFRLHATLFLQYGYDIGVAFGPAASLNCAHKRFEEHPRELLYYAIHELHHVAFMSYQPPPRLQNLKTCAGILKLVKYSTELEGMAVWAACKRRSGEHALADDPDYVALADEARMKRYEASYFEDLRYLDRRGAEPADAAAWAVVERMSGGERLWYRVGALMAQRIEQKLGRHALVELIKKGPDSFLAAYSALKTSAG
jgi:hypothetical protein